METKDKLLLAILKTVPKEQEELLLTDFNEELERMGVLEDTLLYKFLFDNDLVAIYESGFMSMGGSLEFKIKTTMNTKYVYLTENGQVLLWSLQSSHLREKFQELK